MAVKCEDKTIRISKLLIKILRKQEELEDRSELASQDGAYNRVKKYDDWLKNLDKREKKLEGLFEQAYQKSMLEDSAYFGVSN